jgi:hypothetical protein
MMNLFMAVGEILQAANLGTLGTDLFIGTIPAEVKDGVMLREPLDGAKIDDGLRGFYPTEFQVIVRGWDPLEAYNHCLAIQRALRVYRSQDDTNGVYIAWMRPKTLPISYPKGTADDVEVSCRIEVGYGNLTA